MNCNKKEELNHRLIEEDVQKVLIIRGQGYDCKWDFISNTKLYSKIISLKESKSWK